MAAAIGVRGDYEAARLRELAKRSDDANQTRRLLALAAIYDGGSRTEAAKIGGVGLQTVRDWVLAFNAEGPAGLVNGKAPGNTALLTAAHRQALLEIVESGPIPAVHGVVRWRLVDLAQWVFEEFRISISKQTLSRELRALKLRKLWARPGTRPSAPHDQRTRSTYIFGAICPAKGSAAGLILPRCNTAAMALHLEEISRTVTPGAHAVVLLDQAGWHLSDKLDIPANITLMPLPPKSPELNPVENIWQFMRDNWLSNRVFRSYDDILEHCCYAWNKLVDQPWTVMSIGLRDWAHRF